MAEKKRFNLSKAIWKVFLGIISTGIGIVVPQVLPTLMPKPIWNMTIGGLVLEILDWLTYKEGKNE